MSILKNTVLLLKSDKTDESQDKYVDLLESNNFQVMLTKTLTFQYKNLDILREKLLEPDKYSGILLSSPRCVNAIRQALDKPHLEALWGPKHNFSVGEATRNKALQLGIKSSGHESGNARNLAQIIVRNKEDYMKPFLFPHGSLKTDTLKLELGKEQLRLEEVLVYETLPNPDIEKELCNCTNGFTAIPEFVIFFSPSGLHSSLLHLRRAPLDLDVVKLIAIGPVTELAMLEEDLKVHKMAKSPTPEEVLKAVL